MIKLKILFATTHSIEPFGYNLSTWSKLETHPHKYCKVVKEQGHYPFLSYLTLYHKKRTITVHECGYPMIAYPVTLGRGHFNYEISIKLLEDIIRWKGIDIIHIHNYYSLMSDIIVLLSKIKHFLMGVKIPVVAHYHGGNPWLLLPPFRLIKRITIHLIDKFIVSNKAEITRLLSYYKVPLEKIAYIHDGVDTDFFKPLNNISRDNRTLLFVGNLFKEKGVDLLLPILKKCKQRFKYVRLFIAGDGPLRTLLEREIARFRLGDDVILLGRIPWKQLVTLYNKSTVTILPSRSESFGLVLVESMSCGTPVVATMTDGSKEIVTNGVDGFLIPQGDIEFFAEAICKLLSDPALHEQMSINARNKAVNKFSLKRLGERLHKVYCSLLTN